MAFEEQDGEIRMWKNVAWVLGVVIAGSVLAGEGEVRAGLKKSFPATKIEAVRPAPFNNGWYEVIIGGEPFYVDAAGRYLFAGTVIDMATKRNLTQERRDQLAWVDIKSLPLQSAIKRVYGNGKRMLVTFEDPYCSYCKKLATELKAVNNVTVYTFLYPVITPESAELSKRMWCSKNRNQAWVNWMNGISPKLGTSTCKNPIDANIILGQKLHIRSVPTIVFSDGSVMMGYKKAKDIESKLTALESSKTK